MSWYSSPIQPFDPVVVSQTPKPPIRYFRDNFTATGQNSYVKPPAQDQSLWQSLLNVQPITQGILNQRWGYNAFSTTFQGPYNGTITTASYGGSGVHFAGIGVTSTTGLFAGQTVTITGNSNSFFNGSFVVASVSPTSFVIQLQIGTILSQSGSGGTAITIAPSFYNRLSNFQSDSIGTRAILAAGPQGVAAFNESGGFYNQSIFVPVDGGLIRSITSRNYQYFCDGDNSLNNTTHRTGDSLKWNGASSNGVSNIGILKSDVTASTISGGGGTFQFIQGPNTGVNVAQITQPHGTTWNNPVGIFLNNPSLPAFVGSTVPLTNILQATGFFPSLTGSGTDVQGIQVSFNYENLYILASSGGTATIYAQLLKNGVAYGTLRSAPLVIDGTTHTVSIGSASDLWGGSFTPSDLLATNFGVQFYVTGAMSGSGSFKTGISFVTITATTSSVVSGSGASGTGVGLGGGVTGGAINLTLGRAYYLVGNNSLTGHFSDLSDPSGSTGQVTNAEIELALATYNDPQVDTKYVLATADGGDPSILYQTSVLIPGLTIASWAINGSNVATFTGVYTGLQYVAGQTFVVGGLSHGSYLNGQTLTVTSATPTTVVANFTHGADSATETGIAGNYSFAIPNGVTFVIDNTAEVDLVLNQPMLFTDQFGQEFGVADNTPPPAGTLILKHQGRLWMAGVPGATHSVFFSKSITELTLPNGFIAGKYEEAWPGSNYFDVSDGAESVAGLLSDGATLYIGTQNHIRRLFGNSPENFQEPQIVHPEVGVINQEVWQIVFMQGTPSGSIWMTPDFRVIQSDFNTYVDIGTPIQDILNSLQPTAQTLAHASFVADGEFELYILSVPYRQSTYCDTHLVFDLRHRQWFVWQPAAGSLSLLFNISQSGAPQWLFLNGTGNQIEIYNSSATTDNGTVIPISATTTWLHLGEPTRRKVLNEVQVYGNTAMTMTVNGANNLDNFVNPHTVVYNRALCMSPFGTWNLYLTGSKTRHRYYQFTFNSSNGQIPFLGSYAIAATPLDDL